MLLKLPSWLLYLQFQEILSNFSYALVFNFLESVLVVSLIIGLSVLLPRKYFTERFIAQGSLLTILGIGYLMYLANIVGQSKANVFPWDTFKMLPLISGIILIITFLLPRISAVSKVLEDFADRATIFLYWIVPLSAIGGIIILINNLF